MKIKIGDTVYSYLDKNWNSINFNNRIYGIVFNVDKTNDEIIVEEKNSDEFLVFKSYQLRKTVKKITNN